MNNILIQLNMKYFAVAICMFLINSVLAQQQAVVSVDAEKILYMRTESLIGGNIEDLNNQLYGGLYSQLLYGEAFEEEIGVDFIELSDREKLQLWVRRGDRDKPYVWYYEGRGYPSAEEISSGKIIKEFNKSRLNWVQPVKLGSITFTSSFLAFDELPDNLGEELINRFYGKEQISRHWRKVQSKTANGSFILDREKPFTGEQAQQITFNEGIGEWGICNKGLNGWGIKFVKGKPYDGILRIKSEKEQIICVSLRDGNGSVLAKKEISLNGVDDKYQRVTFSLIPSANSIKGSFAITLQQQGTITVDYAFLEQGSWGRYKNMPVHLEMAEAIRSMTVNTFRYNGSMVNRCPEGHLHRWKEMIGPRDERTPYHGYFNPYTSHGFSFFEFMDFCEAMDIDCMIGIRADETIEDVKDLVEYCLGDASTHWGRKRIENGHKKPYRLQTIQIGNEESFNNNYVNQVIELATAIWSKSPEIQVALSVNVVHKQLAEKQMQGMIKIARFVKEQDQADKLILDSHYGSGIKHADNQLRTSIGLDLHDTLAQRIPGFNLRLWPMEENGSRYDWNRGLAHAHNLNTMNRLPLALERSGTANTFQAWNQQLVWNQGRIHFTPEKLIYQTSYYVDRMFGLEWLPVVVQAESNLETLDVTAKMNEEGDILTLYIVNIEAENIQTNYLIEGFSPKSVEVTRIASPDLNVHNTPDNPRIIVSESVQWSMKANMKMLVPGFSFTKIRFKR